MKNELKAGAVLSYVAMIINSVISIIYTPVMLKLLGQSEYGLYSLAGSAAGYIGVLNFGLGNAVIRYTAKYKTLRDEEGCFRIYGLFFIMYVILGAIALIAGMILTFFSHKLFANALTVEEISKLKVLMGITVFNISIGIVFGVFSIIAIAHEKFIFQKVIGIISAMANPFIMLPLLIKGYGSVAIVIVATIINGVVIIINVYYCFWILKIKIIFRRTEMKFIKEIMIFSSFIFLNLVIEKIYWSTDQIILGMYTGTLAVAVYSIGASFSGYFSGFSAAISNVFLSKVTGMVVREVSDREISDLFIKVGRLQYIIISFALTGFIIFGQEFINLWVGEEYSQSYLVAIIILAPMMVSLIQGMGGIILQAKDMHKFRSVVFFIIALFNLVMSILFVQWWGVVGCALATAVSFTIGNILVMNFYYWKKVKIDIPAFWVNIFYMSMPFMLSIIIVRPINGVLLSDNWMFFFIKTIIFSTIFLLLMWFLGMNKYEKILLITPIKKLTEKINKEKNYKVS